MSLSNTTYASALPIALSGMVSKLANMVDPFVTSGLIRRENLTVQDKLLSEGVEVRRLPNFSYSSMVYGRYNRTAMTRNVIKSVTAPAIKINTGHEGDGTHGAIDDPARVTAILNSQSSFSADDAEYLRYIIAGHIHRAYYAYMVSVLPSLYATVNIKSDYDTTTSSAGTQVTFANDVPHTDATWTVDLNDTAVAPDVKGVNMMVEIYDFLAPIEPYRLGEVAYLLVPDSAFKKMALYSDFARKNVRRSDDTESSGTFLYGGSQCVNIGDLSIVGIPNANFPTVTTTVADDTWECLLTTASGIRAVFSTANLHNSISILNSTFASITDGAGIIDTIMNEIQDPRMVKLLSYMGADKTVSMFQTNGAISSNVLPNIIRTIIKQLDSGTQDHAEYYYTRSEVDCAFLRANPMVMRKVKILKDLV